MSSRSAGVRRDIPRRRFWIGLLYAACVGLNLVVVFLGGWEGLWDAIKLVLIAFLVTVGVASDRVLRRSLCLAQIEAELAPLVDDERSLIALHLVLRDYLTVRELGAVADWLVSVDVTRVPPDDRPGTVQRLVELFV